ncbi:MAG: gliding motility-associated C-terminal domain-containing protein, partial [Ferruginibacter sp.]
LNGCGGTPQNLVLTINPVPVMSDPADQSVCSGANIAAINFNSNSNQTTYAWTNNNPAIGLSDTGTGNIASFAGLNSGNTSLTANITVTPTLNGCGGTPQNLALTINPVPVMSDPADQSVCSGANIAAITFSSNSNQTTYAWTNNNPAIGLSDTGTGNIASFAGLNSGNTLSTANIMVTPTLNGCGGTPQNLVLTINPVPVMSDPADQSVCSGANIAAINFNSNSNQTTYAWTNNNPAIGLSATGTGNIASFAGLNSGNTPSTANITVTPTLNGCGGAPQAFVITLKPTPQISQPTDLSACRGTRLQPADLTSTVQATIFTWSNDNPAVGLAASGTGNIPAFQTLNTDTIPLYAIVTVQAQAQQCPATPRMFSILVNPVGRIDSIPDQSVCNGRILPSIRISGNLTGTIHFWINDRPSIGLPASGTGNIPSFTARNTSNVTELATIQVVGITAGQCSTAIRIFKIAVNPSPRVVADNDSRICRGTRVNLSASGAATYSWTPNRYLTCGDCSNPVSTPTQDVVYVVEGTSINGCKNSDTVRINVIQPFNMSVSPNDTLCVGKSVQLNAQRAVRYEWSPATGLNNTTIANPVATPLTSTRYRVIGYDAEHCFTDTGYVYLVVGQNPTVNAGPDIEASTGSTVNLNATAQNGPIVSWNWTPSNGLSCNNCQNPVLSVNNNTTLYVTVENRFGCKAVDTVNVVTFCKNSEVFIANAITPDGDGINDILIVRGRGITVKSFRIFNRWGNLVFEKVGFPPNDPKYGWDGKVKGVPANPDVYVYVAEVVCDNGTPYLYKGNVTILK